MLKIVLVAAGGAAGSVARYLLGNWIQLKNITLFPWGTFTVNILGCLLIGFIGRLAGTEYVNPNAQALLMTGVLGGFTTYSSFGLETFRLLQQQQHITALAYVLFTLILGLVAVWSGHSLSGIFFRSLR